ERIIFLEVVPAICSFKKCEPIDCATGIGNKRVAKLQLVFIKNRKESCRTVNIGIDAWIGVLVNGVAAMSYDIIPQDAIVVVQAGVAELKTLEGRIFKFVIIPTHKTVLRRQLQNKLPVFIRA